MLRRKIAHGLRASASVQVRKKYARRPPISAALQPKFEWASTSALVRNASAHQVAKASASAAGTGEDRSKCTTSRSKKRSFPLCASAATRERHTTTHPRPGTVADTSQQQNLSYYRLQ